MLMVNILGSFPWPLNILILPVCLIFFCMMTCIILSFVFSKPMGFNFLHLISFSFGGETARNSNQDTISGPNLEKLLNITHQRQFIQEIHVESVKEEKKPSLTNVEEKKSIENVKEEKKAEEIEETVDDIEHKTELGAGDHN